MVSTAFTSEDSRSENSRSENSREWEKSGGSRPVIRPRPSAWAQVFLGNPRAEISAGFLREVHADLERAGWPLQRVQSDTGSEFKGDFVKACIELGIRRRKTKPRHPFTNGFVERVQRTLLHEHWWVEFRRRYFSQIGRIGRSLQSALCFYNCDITTSDLITDTELEVTCQPRSSGGANDDKSSTV